MPLQSQELASGKRVTLVQNGPVVESWRLFLLRVAVNCRLDLWSSALVTEVREVGI